MVFTSKKLSLVLALTLVLIWSGTGSLLWLERERALDQARRDVANLALAFEEQSFWILSTVEQTLRTAKAEYEADPAAFNLREFMRQHAMPQGFAIQMSMVGADGYLIDSTLGMGPEARITNYLDRIHVATHVRQDTGAVFIGPPIVGRLSGKWSLPISLRLNKPDGTLAGVIVLSVDPFYLSAYFHKLDLGSEGVVNILGMDGIVRARSGRSDTPDTVTGLGQSMADSAVMALARQSPHGVLDDVSSIDNIRRLMAYRRMRVYPLVAIVGRGVEEILVPWWSLAWRTLIATLVVSLGLGLMVRALERESRRRRAHARDLAEANRLLRLGEQLAMVGHWRFELETRRLTWSDEVYRIHGLRKDKFQPSMEATLAAHHPEDRARLRELVTAAMQTGSSYEMGLRIIRPTGEIRHVVTRGVVEFDAAGKPFAVFGAISDVTDRTAQEEALLVARREAEAAARAKTEFLATVSHELRTPLNAVIGFADLLLAADLPESERRRYIRLQAEAGRTLLAVINDVLDFAKVDAGHLLLEEMPTDTVGMLQTCAELVRPMTQEKGLTLRVEIAPDLPPWLMLDPTRVRQVVLNLLNNAVKFTQAGSVTLTAGTVTGTDGKEPFLRIAVEDTGIGIAPDRQAQLFEPFHQADASTARRYGGTGLGLAICKRLVTLMGGSVALTSDAGRGSRFWIDIPLRPADPPAHAPALPLAVPGEEGGVARPLHVLVAEDIHVNQLLVRAILERAGHKVDIAVDGAAAVEAVQRQAYDLVLMDIQMPGMDGLEATRVIRAMPSVAGRIPILALTANALPSEVERCRQAGMDDHIAKPIEASHLLAALARWSQRIGPAPAQLPAAGAPAPEVMSTVMQQQLEMLMGPGALLTMMQEVASSLRQRLATIADPATPLDTVRSHAHSIVSLAGNFGLMQLSQAARDVEQAIDSAADPASVPVAHLLSAADRAQVALAARIPELTRIAAAEGPATEKGG
ncbi:ATP-binding protein [Niveispirillum sp.]|uniref:ATP-binding protein n=1 Tax=Niveispirillum sp. TaxID=1917217 RepID=UPI001B5FF121|nr:ATP-binding protein [Niveispirillum sp.]MBP7334422.1 response regulator [Niveispirillum sp.]